MARILLGLRFHFSSVPPTSSHPDPSFESPLALILFGAGSYFSSLLQEPHCNQNFLTCIKASSPPWNYYPLKYRIYLLQRLIYKVKINSDWGISKTIASMTEPSTPCCVTCVYPCLFWDKMWIWATANSKCEFSKEPRKVREPFSSQFAFWQNPEPIGTEVYENPWASNLLTKPCKYSQCNSPIIFTFEEKRRDERWHGAPFHSHVIPN